MANRMEGGGGTRSGGMTSSSDVIARSAGTVPRPAPRRAAVPKPKVTRTVRKKVRTSGGSNGSVSRRITRRSSGSSGNSSRKSAPSNPPSGSAKRITPPAPPKPVVPTGSAYLKSDTTYQRQLAAYAKALADFQADQGLARTDYEQGYQGTYRDIGLAKQDASEDLENDYAARGLLKSSLYNTALGDLNTQYQNQYNDLGKQRTSFLDQLGQELTKYKNEQGVQSGNAMQEALRRRAEKYNL